MEKVNPSGLRDTQDVQQRIAAALQQATETLEAFRSRVSEPIAVIGIGCRFPCAESADEYWKALLHGEESISTVPEDRWLSEQFRCNQPKQPGRITFNGGGFLHQIDRFDAKFFEITHREARSMDPQQRLMLEIAWETLENAGIPPANWIGRSGGVFAGICSSDYITLLRTTGLEAIDPYYSTGNAHGAAVGRLSYHLQWNGPSLAIDTACSSSLVAVHLAIQSLRNQECDMALAMGVNVIIAPDLSISLSQAGMLSPSGVSRTFAAGADGFVRGEGCGAILLKRLSDAQRDGDRIFCVLKGSAVNQDGRSNGLTAPNGPAQSEVIRQALRRSSLQPDDIDYIEAHGTGTELGDPIEMGAIGEVFAPRKSPLRVGSVKTNIGHLEGAAGIAGVIKTCLALHHQVIPPHLHFERPSPHIQWQPLIQVADQPVPWPQRVNRIRRAGVSSFGFGGTNAHLILEESPVSSGDVFTSSQEASAVTCRRSYQWIKLSAKQETALHELAGRYADALEHEPLATATDNEVVNAANLGKSDWHHRAAIGFSSRSELIERLRSFATELSSGAPHGHSGSADVFMGIATEPIDRPWVFPAIEDRQTLSVSAEIADELASQHPVFGEYWNEVLPEIRPINDSRLFGCALQIVTAAWFRRLGLQPAAVQAQETGCLAACVAAGVVDLSDAIKIAIHFFESGANLGKGLENQSDTAIHVIEPICPLLFNANVPQTLAQWQHLLASYNESYSVPADSINFAIPPTLVSVGLPAIGQQVVASITTARTLMQLYVCGAKISWPELQATHRRTVSLPSYPFQRQRCWYRIGDVTTASVSTSTIDAGVASLATPAIASSLPPAPPISLLGHRLDLASDAIVFETDLSHFRELADHRLGDQSVFPAAGYLDLASAASHALASGPVEAPCLTVLDLKLHRALTWNADAPTRVQMVCNSQFTTAGIQGYSCRILSRQAAGWELHSTFELSSVSSLSTSCESPLPSGVDARQSPPQVLSASDQYARLAGVGLHYTGVFRCLRDLEVTGGLVCGSVSLDPSVSTLSYELHPALLDGCLQGISALMTVEDELWLPISIGAYQVSSSSIAERSLSPHTMRFTITEVKPASDRLRAFDIRIMDEEQQPIASIQNLCVQKTVRYTTKTADLSPSTDGVVMGSRPLDEEAPYVTRLRKQLCEIIECDEPEIEFDTPLETLGFDSMMATELLHTLEKDYGVKIATDQFWGGLTLGGLVHRIQKGSVDSVDAMDDSEWIEGTL